MKVGDRAVLCGALGSEEVEIVQMFPPAVVGENTCEVKNLRSGVHYYCFERDLIFTLRCELPKFPAGAFDGLEMLDEPHAHEWKVYDSGWSRDEYCECGAKRDA